MNIHRVFEDISFSAIKRRVQQFIHSVLASKICCNTCFITTGGRFPQGESVQDMKSAFKPVANSTNLIPCRQIFFLETPTKICDLAIPKKKVVFLRFYNGFLCYPVDLNRAVKQ